MEGGGSSDSHIVKVYAHAFRTDSWSKEIDLELQANSLHSQALNTPRSSRKVSRCCEARLCLFSEVCSLAGETLCLRTFLQ